MLECKDNVRFRRLTPAMLRMLTALGDLAETDVAPKPLVITSANDGNHEQGSRHYTDEALDLRLHNFASRGTVLRFKALLEKRLGPQFTVLWEDEGTPNEHLHCQVRKGLTYVAV